MSIISQNSSDSVKNSVKTELNREFKRKSIKNDIIQGSFIMGVAVRMGIHLKLKSKTRKMSSNHSLKRFLIEEIGFNSLQNKFDAEKEKWLKKEEVINNEKMKQTDKNDSFHNISMNVLLDFFEENKQVIHYKTTKKSDKVAKRERILSFNSLNEEQIEEIGEKICNYFIKEFNNQNNKLGNDTFIVDSIPNDIVIPLIPFTNNERNIFIPQLKCPRVSNQIQQTIQQNNQFIPMQLKPLPYNPYQYQYPYNPYQYNPYPYNQYPYNPYQYNPFFFFNSNQYNYFNQPYYPIDFSKINFQQFPQIDQSNKLCSMDQPNIQKSMSAFKPITAPILKKKSNNNQNNNQKNNSYQHPFVNPQTKEFKVINSKEENKIQ